MRSWDKENRPTSSDIETRPRCLAFAPDNPKTYRLLTVPELHHARTAEFDVEFSVWSTERPREGGRHAQEFSAPDPSKTAPLI